jgi:hypothetical protein
MYERLGFFYAILHKLGVSFVTDYEVISFVLGNTQLSLSVGKQHIIKIHDRVQI